MERRLKERPFPAKWVALMLLSGLYLLLFLLLCRTQLYTLAGAHNDRLFSADDVYYVTRFFSVEMDTSPRIIKHPLLIVFGWLFTRLEAAVLGSVSVQLHYESIVLLQMLATLLSVVYLYKILDEFYRLRQSTALLLCAIYALAFSTLFFTFVAESYSLSGCILLASYYHARRNHAAALVVLGVLAAGVTLTNAALWAAIVLTANTSRKRRILLLFLGGGCFCLAVALSPVREYFFQNLLDTSLGSAENYSDHFSLLTALRYVLFLFFGWPFFITDTQNASPFGEYAGDALSFLPSAPPLILAAMALWGLLLLAAVLRGRKNPLSWAPLAVLALNVLLHGGLQYGLKEGSLYALHHLSAQILLMAFLFVPQHTEKRQAPAAWAGRALALFLVAELLLNLPGYVQLLQFIEGAGI